MGRAREVLEQYKKFLDVNEEILDLKKEYPKARALIGKVSEAVEWDVVGVMAFCVDLLEDVNAHKEAAELEKFFEKQLDAMDKE